MAALLMLLSSAAPLEAGLAASAAGALFAAFPGRALAGRDKQGGRQAQRPSPESSARPCVWLAVGLAVYGLLVGLSEGFGLHSKSQLGLAAESAAVLCALSATWLYMTKKRPKQERVIRALLVCFASSVLLFSIPHEPARQCGVMLFNATFNVTAAAVWSLMLNASERLANRSLGFCLLCLAYNGSQLLGYLAYDSFLLVLPGGIPYAVFTVIVFAIMLLAAIAPGPAGMSRVPAMRPEVREFVSLDERCGALGAQAGLTERETETVRYVARGWTKSYIASVLGLSENTVKSYLRNAYSKLGVHSRRELLELLEGS